MPSRKAKPLTKKALQNLVLRQAQTIAQFEDEAANTKRELRRLFDERHLLQHEVDAYRQVNQVRPDLIQEHGGMTCLPGCNKNPYSR